MLETVIAVFFTGAVVAGFIFTQPPPKATAAAACKPTLHAVEPCRICQQVERAHEGMVWHSAPVLCDDCDHMILRGDRYLMNALGEAVHPFDCKPLWEQPSVELSGVADA